MDVNIDYCNHLTQPYTDGIANKEGCRLLCQGVSGCLHFTYHYTNIHGQYQRCVLKTSDAGKAPLAGVIYGKKYC